MSNGKHDEVIIRRNPHHVHDVDVIGTVVRLRPGEGFANCDLWDIRYKSPKDCKFHVLPFSTECLELTDSGR